MNRRSRAAGARSVHLADSPREAEPAVCLHVALALPLAPSRTKSLKRTAIRSWRIRLAPDLFGWRQWTRTSRIVLERNPTYREEIYDFDVADTSPPLRATSNGCGEGAFRWSIVSKYRSSRRRSRGWLSFEQGALDHLLVPIEYGTLVAPNGKLAPNLARRGVQLDCTPMADLAMSYFNMEHPLVGGYTPRKSPCDARSAWL